MKLEIEQLKTVFLAQFPLRARTQFASEFTSVHWPNISESKLFDHTMHE